MAIILNREVITLRNIIKLFTKYTRVFILGAVLVLSFSGIAMAEQNDEYVYKVENGEVVLTSYIATSSDATKVEVPSEIDGMKVIGLEGTFYENQTIETVVLPEGIRFLGYNTFNDCETLSEINLPNCLEVIGEGCFYNTGLIEVILPASVESVGINAFSNCKRLQRIDISKTDAACSSYAFAHCINLTEVILPETMEYFSTGLFSGCTSLVEITCPQNLKLIGANAFGDCSSLLRIELSDKLESIGGGLNGGAFVDCISLQEIELPDSLKKIEVDAFNGCINLKEINLPENLEYIGNAAFMHCDSIQEFSLPGNLTHENIGSTIITGKKIRKIINNTPYSLDKRVFEYNSALGPCTWYTDENCTKPAESLPGNAVIYRSKAELYGNMCTDILSKAPLFEDGVSMADMNSKEEIAAYLCRLLPSSEEVSYSIDFFFSKAWAGTKTLPNGFEGYADTITITVKNNYSEIDKATVRIPGKIIINQTVYNESGGNNPGGSASNGDGSGNGGDSGSGDSGSGSSGSGSSDNGGSGGGSGSGSSGNGGSGGGSNSGGFGNGGSGNGSSSGGSGRKSTSATLPSYVVQGTWVQNGEQWSFTDASGEAYRNRWAAVYNPYANVGAGQSNFDWFWFDANGVMITGWHLDSDGNYYYLNPSSDGTKGRMVTGWVWIADGTGVQKCYYFNPVSDGTRGKLIKDTVVEGYTVNGNGEWTVNGIVQTK